MPIQRINPDRIPRETWEAVKRGLGIEIDKGKIEREAKAARRVHAGEEENPEYEILKTYSRGGNLFEALRIAGKEGKMMLSFLQWKRILEDPELFKEYKSALPAWSSTGIAYGAPGEELGKRIVYHELAVEIPKEYQKSKNTALIFPNLRIEKDSTGLYHVNTAEIDVIGGFPSENGWYILDSKYALPCGRETEKSDQSALYLWRRDTQHVSAVVTSFSERTVSVSARPGTGLLGVVVGDAASKPHQR